MPAYAAFLRGVSPMNLKMPALKTALESAGFGDVKTLLSSGNVVFSARRAAAAAIERKVEAAIEQHVGKKFGTIVRSIDELQLLIEADPYRPFKVSAKAKRVVTFLREAPAGKLHLPPEQDGARILCLRGRELLSAYERSDKGPVFMVLIERTVGRALMTSRTWDTVLKVAKAGAFGE